MRRANISDRSSTEANLLDVFRSDGCFKNSINTLIGMMGILMILLLCSVHLSKIVKNLRDLTFGSVVIFINLLMQTDEQFPASHHTGLSSVFS